MKIDQILRSKKTNRPRKKKNNDEVLDSFADDEVARLRETMNNAADEDIRSNQEKLPATAKLRLLPEAMETLRKSVSLISYSSIEMLIKFPQSLARAIDDRQQPP